MPATNALTSLMLLNSDLSGFDPWVLATREAMSPEQLQTNSLVCHAAAAFLGGTDWPSFPAWVEDLARREPYDMRDRSLSFLLEGLQTKLGWDPDQIPSREQLLADQDTYLDLIERTCEAKGAPCDLSHYALEHEYLQDPIARQELMVKHLSRMWDEHLATEWMARLSLIEESVAAFELVDYGGMTASEIVSEVTARDALPRDWESWLPETVRLAFAPSAHIGPYMILMDRSSTGARIVFGARVPTRAQVVSPELNRSELLIRLGALADDSRLRILELLAREGELCAQQVISYLGMSQSSVSRHLRQLVATGYVTERRREGSKAYSLNPDRLEDTLNHLKQFLR
jgi:DNA-binding transcriptional ArsR family regulator